MVDLLVSAVLVGFAVTYLLELLDLTLLGAWISKTTINAIFSLPFSIGGMYILHGWMLEIVVSTPAAIFVALFLNRYLNKPAVIPSRLPRL